MTTLKELGERYKAWEKVDTSDFRHKARILQSLWREQQGFPVGEHQGLTEKRPLGSRLPMPEAEVHLWNYLSDNIKAVVRREVLDPIKSQGKTFSPPRIFNDLLSSQPLCFNLFGELQCDLTLATQVFRGLCPSRIERVTAIEFEHSPGRGDPRYSGDNSAFDVFVNFLTPAERRGFVGIEVKYHEDLATKPAFHRSRYDEITTQMGCFKQEHLSRLPLRPLEQIWRDHLLAGALRQVDGYADSLSWFVYPKDNWACASAVKAYCECLSCTDSFAGITLETMVEEIRRHTSAAWIQSFEDRYLAFDKIDKLLWASS